jgi:hypothetical protein
MSSAFTSNLKHSDAGMSLIILLPKALIKCTLCNFTSLLTFFVTLRSDFRHMKIHTAGPLVKEKVKLSLSLIN